MSETVKDNIVINEKISSKGTVNYTDGAVYTESLSDRLSDISQWYTDEQLLHFMKKLGYTTRTLYDIPDDVKYIVKEMPKLSLEDSFQVLKDAIVYYEDDENLPHDQYEEWKSLAELESPDWKEQLDEYDSFN